MKTINQLQKEFPNDEIKVCAFEDQKQVTIITLNPLRCFRKDVEIIWKPLIWFGVKKPVGRTVCGSPSTIRMDKSRTKLFLKRIERAYLFYITYLLTRKDEDLAKANLFCLRAFIAKNTSSSIQNHNVWINRLHTKKEVEKNFRDAVNCLEGKKSKPNQIITYKILSTLRKEMKEKKFLFSDASTFLAKATYVQKSKTLIDAMHYYTKFLLFDDSWEKFIEKMKEFRIQPTKKNALSHLYKLRAKNS